MKLVNPYAATGLNKLYVEIDDASFNYLFRGVFAGCRQGHRAAILGIFIQKLHEACVASNIKPVFDPENESIVAGMLARLNFTEPAAASAGSSNPRTPVHKDKPRTGRRNGTGGTAKVHAGSSKESVVAGDPVRQP